MSFLLVKWELSEHWVMKPGRANKNGSLGEPIKSEQIAEIRAGRFCNPEATRRQTVTTMRANCNHELSQPGLLIWEESKRFECNFKQPGAQKLTANPVRWGCQKSRLPYTRRALLCSP